MIVASSDYYVLLEVTGPKHSIKWSLPDAIHGQYAFNTVQGEVFYPIVALLFLVDFF